MHVYAREISWVVLEIALTASNSNKFKVKQSGEKKGTVWLCKQTEQVQ